jgi:hypothetical protein
MGLRHSHSEALAFLATLLLIFGSVFAKADDASKDDLVKLARKHFNYDSIKSKQEQEAFDKFFLSVHQGENADFAPKGSSEEDASKGNSWGPERSVKAGWIMWLCQDPDAVKMVQAKGIQVYWAKIDGEMDLSWLKMEFPLRFNDCNFTGSINLSGASLRGLNLEGSHIGLVKQLSVQGR